MKGSIVIIGYNRADSVIECYNSVSKAIYDEDKIDLIFSLDYHEKQNDIYDRIKDLEWNHGDLIIKRYSERQGLKNHVLQCGDYVNNYDFIVMLEDDIRVSNSFYLYIKAVLEKFNGNKNIACISLYQCQFNEAVGRKFIPQTNDSDCYMMSLVQSWGQCWTKSMWSDFRTWYANNQEFPINEFIPKWIYDRDSRAWTNLFQGYMSNNNKYVVYPYLAYSTNTSLAGEHSKNQNSNYETPLVVNKKHFNICDFDESVKYDAFLERENDIIFDYQYNNEKVLLDLYGTRTIYGNAKYLASVNRLPYEVVESYGLVSKPHEINLVNKTQGDTIFLYDLTKKLPKTNPISNNVSISLYESGPLSWKRCLLAGIIKLFKKYKKR